MKSYHCSCKRLTIYCCCISIVILIILYLILFQAYHIGCIIYATNNNGIKPTHICEPWINVIYAFIEIPNPISSNQQLIQYSQQINNDVTSSHQNSLCQSYPNIIKQHNSDKYKNIEFAILLSQRRGGSNFAELTLSKHSQIITGHEVTMRWFHFHCTQFVYNKKQKCQSKQILSVLNKWFVDQSAADRIENNSNRKQVFLVKLQIEQFWTSHYRDFIHYISCNNITIIHYIRSAQIASYLSHSIDAIERFQTGNILTILSKPRTNKDAKKRDYITDSIWLDPEISKEYVFKINSLHNSIKYLIQNYAYNNIKYQTFYYENFIDNIHAKYYWNAIQSFLGIDIVINGNESWIKREHNKPCFQKISNWDQIQSALNGTDSVYACEMWNS